MADFDLILRSAGTVHGSRDIGVLGGKIGALEKNLPGTAEAEIILSGKHVFPGFIDAHVHFNEPGRTGWEGIATGSRALAAGGGTVFCDMPLNSSPPVLDAGSFTAKRKRAEAKSMIDFSLWGGLVPGNRREIPGLAEAGAAGLKAFLAHSGLDEFPRVTPADLRDGMKGAAECGLPVAVHAESQEVLDALEKKSGNDPIRRFLDSRPVAAETEAIRIACELAGETGCALHVVHVSSPDGIAVIDEAKREGIDVTAETCPHYLLFSENDLLEWGAVAKCAPPLRPPGMVEALKAHVLSGGIDTIGSDHSPSPPAMKSGDFEKAWGGIAGCQHAFPAFLGIFRDPGLAERLLSRNPARRLGIDDRKGSLETGKDADFAIVDFSESDRVEAEALLYRHPVSPYVGREIGCRIEMTFCRGRLVHGRCESPGIQRFEPCSSQFLARREPG